jgi:hypothetical protein
MSRLLGGIYHRGILPNTASKLRELACNRLDARAEHI